MSNYFVSYDLNGKQPTHAEMDKHLKKLGPCVLRVLETVWYVGYSGSADALYDHANSILSNNDRLLVMRSDYAAFRNLLVPDDSLLSCWNKNG